MPQAATNAVPLNDGGVLAVPPGQASAFTVKLVRAVDPVNPVPAASFVAVASTEAVHCALAATPGASGLKVATAPETVVLPATVAPSQISLIPAAARVLLAVNCTEGA